MVEHLECLTGLRIDSCWMGELVNLFIYLSFFQVACVTDIKLKHHFHICLLIFDDYMRKIHLLTRSNNTASKSLAPIQEAIYLTGSGYLYKFQFL